MRIGLYVCECGINIASTVDVEKVVEYAKSLPNIAVSKYYKYMCSDPGQEMIKTDVKESGLHKVVVASCSPRMHEPTFRGAIEEAGLNGYCLEMANIREQCSWVHKDKEKATIKAIRIVTGAVLRAAYLEPLQAQETEINKNALVVGGGIVGIQAALDIADTGSKVYLLEKEPSIGGRMAQLDKTFPTLDCSACILTPKTADVPRHPNIELLTYSEMEEVSGFVGNFKVKVRKKPRYIDIDKCTGCGLCAENCLVRNEVSLNNGKHKVMEQPEVGEILEKYQYKPELIISVLQDIQGQKNYLPQDSLEYVSEKMKIPLSKIYKLATFYKAFSLTPRGRHLVSVCLGTACHVRGAVRIKEEFERRLEIKAGETTKDLMFTLETVNCLGCCSLGPIVVVDGDYHGEMAVSKVDTLIQEHSKVSQNNEATAKSR